MEPTVVQIVSSQDQTEGSDPGIEDQADAAKEEIPFFAHPFFHLFDIVGETQQDETGSQDDTPLKASSWTVMAMGDHIKAIQLDEWREDSTDRLDDDIFKKGDHLVESPEK
jgi:hypothetical protein